MADEFLIFNIGTDPAKVGASYALLGVAKSEQEAREMLGTMPTPSASKAAIVQKKAYIRRTPSVRLEDLAEDIVKP